MKDNLITSLYYKLKDNIGAMSQIDWLDVEVYCTACVAGREKIYNSEDYEELTNKMHYLCREINAKVNSNDYRNAILMLAELSGMISAMPEIEHYREVIYQAELDKMLSEHYRNNTIVVIGDSHVNFFSGHEMLDYTPVGNDIHWCKTINEFPVTALHIGAGLAYNSMKYGTTCRFREKTEYMLTNYIKPESRILVTLGEVDCRAHVFRQTEKQGRDYHDIIEDIVDNYISFLMHISKMGFRVGCWGPIASQSDKVPVHPDDPYPKSGDEVSRNKATEYFNERMYHLCKESDIDFLSVFHELIDNNFRTKTEYYSSDGVHLNQSAMPLAVPLLKRYGYI